MLPKISIHSVTLPKILLFLATLTCFSYLLHAQDKHDANWIIGYDDNSSIPGGIAIVLGFNNGNREVFNINTVEDFHMEGSNTSMNDKNGNLLFYCNGCFIVNAAHENMANGDSINPGWINQFYCVKSGSPYVQGVLSIPAPGSEDLFYVFNIDMQRTRFDTPGYRGHAPQHLLYHVIDMSQDDGLGAVVLKNQIAIQDTLARANLQAARHSNGVDWWVIMPEIHSNCYYKILVTKDGLSEPIKQCIGRVWSDKDVVGQAAFSPNRKKYTRFHSDNGLNIFDFDAATGELSNPLLIEITDHDFTFGGAAISPNSRYLYLSAYTKVFQYDLEATDIAASRVTIAEWDGFRNPFPTIFYLAALAPDGKIYIASTSSTYNLHVINNPDCPGLASDLVQHGVTLPSLNFATIPNIPHYRDYGDMFSVCTTAAHEENKVAATLRMYPNPTSGIFTMETERSGSVHIFDALGRLVHTDSFNGFKSIDISNAANGLYLVAIRFSDGTLLTQKLIVQD